MIKEIKYLDLTTEPSDYECADGELSACVNLINEDGTLRPLEQPTVIGEALSNHRILMIHSVPGRKNFIVLIESLPDDDGTYLLGWLPVNDPVKKNRTATLTTIGTVSNKFNGYRDITAVGNTLCVATDDGLHYFLWKDSDYIDLGNRPPFVAIDFGCWRQGIISEKETWQIPNTCNPFAWGKIKLPGVSGVTTPNPSSDEDRQGLTQKIFGFVNPIIADNITGKGYFYQPFFVRYAFRLYDGSYCWQSAPILQLPAWLPPQVQIRKTDDTSLVPDMNAQTEIEVQYDQPYFGLAYRTLLTDDIKRQLENWSDIVKGIDVFISAPLYTYDQSKDIEGLPYVSPLTHYASAQSAFSLGAVSGSAPSVCFVGHYGDTIAGPYADHTVTPEQVRADLEESIWNIPFDDEVYTKIRSCHEFYRVAELNVDTISNMAAMNRLPLISDDLSALPTLERLPDDYQSHTTLIPSSLYGFNSRLNAADCQIIPATPYPIRSAVEFSDQNANTTPLRILVYSRLNGVMCYAERIPGNYDGDRYDNNIRYIYYPDASAFKMEIYSGNSLKYSFDLKAHEFLNGAFWAATKFTADVASINSTDTTDTSAALDRVPVTSKIYASEASNPFVFPVTGIVTVGSGTVMAMCAAVKALSQGQFGQFPLYAFTTEGVWALTTTSTGTYAAVQPVTRDVCLSPDSICQLDSSVLFATDRGIMHLSGSTSTCISDSLDSQNLFSVVSLPHGAELLAMLDLQGGKGIFQGQQVENSLEMIPFHDFITGCRMIYDYIHQRVIIYREAIPYAYVWSLKSKGWGTMTFGLLDSVTPVPDPDNPQITIDTPNVFNWLRYDINAYPEAFAVNANGDLLDICHSVDLTADDNDNEDPDDADSEEPLVNALVVTRPLKLDYPNNLKTVDQVYQRGFLSMEHVGQVLYGSRDLMQWYRIWDSSTGRMRLFRGTPYKYFRLALTCRLSPKEKLYGCSVSYRPRFTNHLR